MLFAPTVTTPLVALRREIERLAQDTSPTRPGAVNEWSPAVDIRETEHELTFAVELPEIQPDEVEVTAQDGILVIRGQRPERDPDGRYHLVERNVGPFMRHFHLPQGVDTDTIEANFEHGLLEVRIQKVALPQPTRIHVKVGTAVSDSTRQGNGRRESRQQSTKKLAGAHSSK